MNILDIILLVCFIPAIISGLRKGFIAQVVAIISIVLGVWLSVKFATLAGSWISQWIEASPQVINIISFAVIFIAIELFRASGLSALLSKGLSYPFRYLGIPPEISELVLLVPMSGNGALALLEDIMNTYGPDSYIARCASTIAGASETIFYISAVYFTKCKVKRLRYAIPVALFGSFCGMVIACALCRVM